MIYYFRKQNGQSLAELAIVLPLLLMLLLGIFDIGNGFSTYIALSNASREGARWVSIHPADKNGAVARVYAEAGSVGLGQDTVAVTFIPDQTTYNAGDSVTLQVAHSYPLLFGAITQLPVIDFEIESTMKVLYNP